METIHITYPHTLKKEQLPETIATIGFFDGVHKGHQTLIQEAVSKAKSQDKKSAVISFHPHPSIVLKQSTEEVQYITTIEEKTKLLAEMGVDIFYIITFNKELSLLQPKEFVHHFIVDLNIKHLIAGFDFTFGYKGAGNMTNIREYSEDKFTVSEMEKVIYENEKISSTRIRKKLASGAVADVIPLLDRYYQTTGKVVGGDKRGRQLGFPTANMERDDNKLLPRQGVYAVTVNINGGLYKGMANLGVKPTFQTGEMKPAVEVFIFEFDQDIYGETITVYWHTYIREEKKFNGIEEIVQQLKQDEEQIRHYFK